MHLQLNDNMSDPLVIKNTESWRKPVMVIKVAFSKKQHKVGKMMIFLLLCAVCI